MGKGVFVGEIVGTMVGLGLVVGKCDGYGVVVGEVVGKALIVGLVVRFLVICVPLGGGVAVSKVVAAGDNSIEGSGGNDAEGT